jgi:Raf kinase inhibitor-like YbhB/YbcL family protein
MGKADMSFDKRIGVLGVMLAITLVASARVSAQEKSAAHSKFVLSSPDSKLAAKVPEEYTANVFGCSAPAGTKSYVVTLFDPDEHGDPSGWWHWIVYNLPASVTSLPKGAGAEHSSVFPAGTQQGRTDLGNDAYHGPCPDKGDPPHRYTFTVYTLNIEKVDVPPDSSGAMVVSTAREHVVGTAVFIAHYGR